MSGYSVAFGRNREHFGTSVLERDLDKKAHLLESEPQEESAPWYRVVIERPKTDDERKRLGETIKQIGLESPWRLIVGQVGVSLHRYC